MTISDELFQLKKSITIPEKIYFKKFASLFHEKESNNYLKLFNEIDKQIIKNNFYDEAKIKKGIYSGKFIKNISYHKNYLYSMIMNSLILYQRENKDLITLRNLISQAELLIDKLLFDQCKKVLQRARKIAADKEAFTCLLEILYLEKELYKNTLSFEEQSEKSNNIDLEQNIILEKIKNISEYMSLSELLGRIVKKTGTGFSRNADDNSEMIQFFEHPLIKDYENAKTFKSKTLFNSINFQHSLTSKDYQKGYLHIKKNVNLWENNLSKANGRLENYIYSLTNLLNCQIRVNKFEEFDNTAEKMKQLAKNFPKHITIKNKVFIFFSLTVMTIAKCFEALDKNGLEKINKEAEDNFLKYESSIELSQRIILYYFLGTSNFVLENFEKCIFWMVK
ncbi:MAG: hypothetical protein M3R36_06710 [Bacteroidota bacterium]|nr:hypothetical protein [Bacteroidota bacterium]